MGRYRGGNQTNLRSREGNQTNLSVAFMYLSRKSFCFLSKKSSRANEQSPASFIVGKRTDIGVLSVMGRRHNSFGTVIPPKFVAQTGKK